MEEEEVKLILDRYMIYKSKLNCVYDTKKEKWKNFRKCGRKKRKYWACLLGKKMYYFHRLYAEAFIANPDNKKCIDHRDGDGLNNNLDNLRWVTHQENNKNKGGSVSVSGYRGVYMRGSKFYAMIRIDGKLIYLGNRLTAEKAFVELYVEAAKKFGFTDYHIYSTQQKNNAENDVTN